MHAPSGSTTAACTVHEPRCRPVTDAVWPCRSFLVLSGNKQSPWYKVNGIALAIVFFFARIIVYGLGLWHMWQSR